MTRRVLTVGTAVVLLLAGGGYALHASELLVDERCLGPGLLCTEYESGTEEVGHTPLRTAPRSVASEPGSPPRRSRTRDEAEVAGTVMESYTRARCILDDAVAAHGGGSHGSLRDAADFPELLRQPVIR